MAAELRCRPGLREHLDHTAHDRGLHRGLALLKGLAYGPARVSTLVTGDYLLTI